MTSPLWAAFGPAEAYVSCGGGQHTLRWADGAVEAVDHPDAEAELVIAALGGAPTPCLDLVRAWGRHREDLSVLAVGPRSANDLLTLGPDAIEELASPDRHGWGLLSSPAARRAALARAPVTGSQAAAIVRSSAGLSLAPGAAGTTGSSFATYGSVIRKRSSGYVPMGGAHADPRARFRTEHAELFALMALGPQFQFRMSASVANAWSAEGQRSAEAVDAAPALIAALASRLAPAAARWLGVDPGDVETDIHEGTGWGAIELTRSAGGQTLHAELPVSWLARVWAPGLAVVSGHLVTGVLQAAWPTARVLALKRPATAPVELSLRHGDDGWSVTD